MPLFQQLFNHYNEFHETEISTNRFSPEKFNKVLLAGSKNFKLKKLGESVDGRPINAVFLGNGVKKILLWSQMHGNESTATRAILDILNFFSDPSNFNDIASNLIEELTICILPMLNPDGTYRFQRRNALEVDLNRDARSFEAPESKILREIIQEFKPDYAFNLHDQRRFYNVDGTGKPSTIAFLAPAYNIGEETNPSRSKAMQLIAQLRSQLEAVIPGQIGIYDDTYSHRAFGDYTQSTGASTILVESGWAADDMEKEFVRKLNFCLLVSAFGSIMNNSHDEYSESDYKNIPMKDEKLFDVLIRNATIKSEDSSFKVDIGIQRNEISILNSTNYYSISEVADIGDLQEYYGFNEVVGTNLVIEPGLVWQNSIIENENLTFQRGKIEELLKQGYLYMAVAGLPEDDFMVLPINIVSPDYKADTIPKFEGKANFLLKDTDGRIRFLIINGFLWNIEKSLPDSINGLVFR